MRHMTDAVEKSKITASFLSGSVCSCNAPLGSFSFAWKKTNQKNTSVLGGPARSPVLLERADASRRTMLR